MDIYAAPRNVIIGAKIKFPSFYTEFDIIFYIIIFGQKYSLPLPTVISREKIKFPSFYTEFDIILYIIIFGQKYLLSLTKLFSGKKIYYLYQR